MKCFHIARSNRQYFAVSSLSSDKIQLLVKNSRHLFLRRDMQRRSLEYGCEKLFGALIVRSCHGAQGVTKLVIEIGRKVWSLHRLLLNTSTPQSLPHIVA